MADNSPNVNVIFHGLFLFVQQKGFVDVVIPNMGIEHVYRVGTFLAEETLLPLPLATPYYLSGVTGGAAKFDITTNIVFSGQDFDHSASADDVYARMVLPVPIEIRSLRPTNDALQADYDPGGVVDGKKPCGVQTLRYFAPDLGAVRLAPRQDTFGLNSDNKTLNLHIIAEPDTRSVPADHVKNGFEMALHLIPGVTTPIFIKNQTFNTLDRNDDAARGFAAIELLDITERAAMLAQAGIDWRDGNPHLGVVDDTPVDAPPFDCLPVMCDNT